MKTRCAACGATASLDVLIAHEGARLALKEAFALSGALGSALVRYLGLFRPTNREQTLDRVAKLLGEVLPDVQRGRITRGGRDWAAPREVWISAIETVCSAPGLKLPLKSHGYLYAVIAGAADAVEAKAEAALEQKRAYAASTDRHAGNAAPVGAVLAEAASQPREKTPMPESVAEQLATLGIKRRKAKGDQHAAE